MPRVGCDAKRTQTTGWRPKTRSAPIITRPIDSLILVQLLRRWHNIDQSMVDSLFSGNSATGTVKAVFYNHFILPHFAINITVCDD